MSIASQYNAAVELADALLSSTHDSPTVRAIASRKAEEAFQRLVKARGETEDKEVLGRFGHHPDPAIDFEVEVETLQGQLYDATHGVTSPDEIPAIRERIDNAMGFRVGGDLGAISAKTMLRGLAANLPALTSARRPDMSRKSRAEAANV